MAPRGVSRVRGGARHPPQLFAVVRGGSVERGQHDHRRRDCAKRSKDIAGARAQSGTSIAGALARSGRGDSSSGAAAAWVATAGQQQRGSNSMGSSSGTVSAFDRRWMKGSRGREREARGYI